MPEDVLIKTDTPHQHGPEGTVHVCEFGPGKIFRSIHFPEQINLDRGVSRLETRLRLSPRRRNASSFPWKAQRYQS